MLTSRCGGDGLRVGIVVGIGSVIARYLLPTIAIHLGAAFIRSVISAFIGAFLMLTVVLVGLILLCSGRTKVNYRCRTKG